MKNIIFDLGGIILNIDFQRTIRELQKYTSLNVSEFYTGYRQHKFFDLYETGSISSIQFRNSLREKLSLVATDDQIDAAWNALLLDIPRERIELLQKLAKNKRIFLYSNTCEIHKLEIDKIVYKNFGIEDFNSLFENAYYSHILRFRKPHPEGFLKILKDNNLKECETLFIDDSAENIKGAKLVGLNTFHLCKDKTILDLDLL